MKKYMFPDKLEIVNIVVAIIGIVMIFCSSLLVAVPGSIYSKLLSIMGDLGIGIFPTGLIGFILERIQNRNKAQETHNKRLAILSLFNNAVHGYLNIICNEVIKKRGNLKNERVFEIITAVNNIQMEYSESEIVALTTLIRNLQEVFSLDTALYIVTDVFEAIEISHFSMLLGEGKKLLNLMKENRDVMESRRSFLSYLQITCFSVPECNNFNLMISDGDNIFVPKK